MSEYVSQGDSLNGFFASIKSWWKRIWDGLIDFITGKTCRSKCSSFFDFRCHVQYVCVSWILMFGLLLTIFPTVIVLLWLLHQKGFFDPLHDWWDDRFGNQTGRTRIHSKHENDSRLSHALHHKEHHIHVNGRRHGNKQSSHGRHGLVMHRYPPLALSEHRHHRYDSHAHVHNEVKHKHKHRHNKPSKHGPPLLGESSGARGHRSGAKHHEEKQAAQKHGHEHTPRSEFYSKAHDRDNRHKMF